MVPAKHAGSRGALLKGLPSAPVLVGVTALAAAAMGAVTSGTPELVVSSSNQIVQASALSGTGGTSSSDLLAERATTVSRDSRRDALDDAASEELVAQAERQARQRNVALAKFAKQAQAQAAKIALNQWVLPLSEYRLTAEFGEYGLWANYHTGLDFAAPTGTPLVAMANAVITSAGYDGPYGYKTVLTLEDGTELWYAHQDSISVSEGDVVRAGEVIGAVGATGNVTGPHVHLEVRPGAGDPVDPYGALLVRGLTP